MPGARRPTRSGRAASLGWAVRLRIAPEGRDFNDALREEGALMLHAVDATFKYSELPDGFQLPPAGLYRRVRNGDDVS